MRLPFRTPTEVAAGLERLSRHLCADGLIAYPTETVYGFGGRVSVAVIDALRTLKRRSPDKPFLLLITGPEQLPELRWSPAARRLARAFWPGPLTLVLPGAPGALPPGVQAPDGSLAVRCSPHPATSAVLRAARGPVISTSANLAGEPAATSVEQVQETLQRPQSLPEVLILDGGPLPPSPPSTIVSCAVEPPRIVRLGAVGLDDLKAALEELDA